MAIVKPSAVIDGIRGSVGGVTFSANHYGPHARLRVVPTQPISQARAESQQRLSIYAIWWTTQLTGAQRTAWNTLGAATTWQNALGEDYNPTGEALYVRSNVLMDINERSYTAVAPDAADEADPGFTLDYNAPDQIRITNLGTLTTPPDGRLQVYWSGVLSPGKSAHSGPWTFAFDHLLSNLPPTPRSILNIGSVHPAGNVFLRLRVYRTTNTGGGVQKGRASAPFFHTVAVTAAP